MSVTIPHFDIPFRFSGPVLPPNEIITNLLTLSGNEITPAKRITARAWGITQLGGSVDLDVPGNMIPNPSIETTLFGWNDNANPGGTLNDFSLSTGWAQFGASSMHHKWTQPNDTSVRASGVVWLNGTQGIPVIPGTTYALSVYVKTVDPGQNSDLTIFWFKADGTTSAFGGGVSSANYGATPTGRIVLIGTAPSDAYFASPAFHLNTALANDVLEFYLDGWQMERASAATPYIDGSFPNCYWIGTAHSSNTYRSAGLGIYRAATNLFRYGQTDSLGGVGVGDGGTIISIDSTVPPLFSPQCVKAVCNGAIATQHISHSSSTGLALAVGTNCTASCWFRGTAGALYFAQIYISNTDTTLTTSTLPLTFNASGDWQLIIPPAVAVAAGKIGDDIILLTGVSGTRADTWRIANVMLEAGVDAAVSPYVATFGGSLATRPAARVQAPISGLFSPSLGWIAARIRTGNPVLSGFLQALMLYGDGNNAVVIVGGVGTNQWTIYSNVNGAEGIDAAGANFTAAAGDHITVIGAWDTINNYINVNGSAASIARSHGVPGITTTLLDIGTLDGWYNPPPSQALAGDILWLMTGAGPLSSADYTAINAIGDPCPSYKAVSPTALITSIMPMLDSTYQLAWEGRSANVVQQDSGEDVTNCVEAVVRTQIGTRMYVPQFGITDPTFSVRPMKTQEMQQQIEQSEPRASAALTSLGDVVDTLIENISVEVSNV